MKTRHFVHNGKDFELRSVENEEMIRVRVYLDGKQVTCDYAADGMVARDFRHQNGRGLLELLEEMAESDVRNGRTVLRTD